jgi:predicted ATPase
MSVALQVPRIVSIMVPGAHLVAISNYRSLRNLAVPLKALNVVTGPNGSGKSSFYRALRLLADTAQGRVVPSLAREGGLQSTLWAGPESISRSMKRGDCPVQGTRRKHPVSLRLGFAGVDFGYLIDLGLPPPGRSAFSLDPEIKRASAFGMGRSFGPRRCSWIAKGRWSSFAARTTTGTS